MPQKFTLYRIFLASPGDVVEELAIASRVIQEWNLQHGEDCDARIEVVNWRTHTHPATGARPQALINKQAVEKCDIVVGIFWAKFGSPTGRASSGTVEEIELGVRRGKKVMVYFSERPTVSGGRTDPAIEAFQKQFGQNAIWWSYNKLSIFERDFRSHLAATMHELL